MCELWMLRTVCVMLVFSLPISYISFADGVTLAVVSFMLALLGWPISALIDRGNRVRSTR